MDQDADARAALDELRAAHTQLLAQLAAYKRLDEDLAAQRVFEKAKSRLAAYLTVGGLALVATGAVGIKSLTDYAETLVQKRLDTVSQSMVQSTLEKQAERRVADMLARRQSAIEDMVRQQVAGIITASQGLGAIAKSTDAGAPSSSTDPVPPTLDLASGMLPVRDSGPEGSVVGFSLAAVAEYQLQRATHERTRLSPRFIYYFARPTDQRATDGGALVRDGVDVMRTRGTVADTAWPYRSGEFASPPPAATVRATHYVIEEARRVASVEELKRALQRTGPVVGGVPLYQSSTGADVARTGVIPMPGPRDAEMGATSLVFVGYDDARGRIKFLNSWGSSWGDGGYGYLPYEYVRKFLTDAWELGRVRVVTPAR